MYVFYLDDDIIYYPGDKECMIMEPQIDRTLNEAGSCEFQLPPDNPYYDSLHLRQSMITVKRDGDEVFCGEVRECPKDHNNVRKVYAVGELAFLHNSRQPQVEYGEVTPAYFMGKVLDAHNEQVEERQRFYLGYVTISNGFNPINFVTDHEDTLDVIRTMLLDNLGGVLRIRKVNGVRYLDYVTLAEYGSYNTQGITFGENLMDYAENYSANNVVTAIIPRGAEIEDDSSALVKHVDITSVNSGKDYLINTTAVSNFGYIWDVVDFGGITEPSELKEAAQAYLQDTQYEDLELEVTAADLSQMDSSMAAFDLGDQVLVTAAPYGMSRTFPVKSQTLYPQAPQNERLKLSANIRRKSTYTASSAAKTSATSATVKKETLEIRSIIKQEIANIIAQFTGSAGGYKLETYDENGLWLNTRYMNAPNIESATEIREDSMVGIRFFRGAAGEYTDPTKWTTAWTIGGQFYANFINAGTMMGERVKAGTISDVADNMSWNLETGALSAKRLSIDSTNFDLTEDGTASMTNATINGGTITQTSGIETLTIGNTTLVGKRGNTDVGYIDLSADTGSDNGIVYDAVLGSHGRLRLEFYQEIDFVDTRTNTQVGYLDGNGYHGPIDESYLST